MVGHRTPQTSLETEESRFVRVEIRSIWERETVEY